MIQKSLSPVISLFLKNVFFISAFDIHDIDNFKQWGELFVNYLEIVSDSSWIVSIHSEQSKLPR